MAINAFPGDFDSEHQVIREVAEAAGARVAVTRHVALGGAGALDLVDAVEAAAQEPTEFRYAYDLDEPLADKLTDVARDVYGAAGIDLSPVAAKGLAQFEALGLRRVPRRDRQDAPVDLERPGAARRSARLADAGARGARRRRRRLRLRHLRRHAHHAGALGTPAAERIDIDADGEIVGLS